MKTLTVVSARLNRPDLAEAVEMERRDEIPRVSLYQRYLESDLLDERFMMDRVPGWRKALYTLVPKPLDQVLEAYVLGRSTTSSSHGRNDWGCRSRSSSN